MNYRFTRVMSLPLYLFLFSHTLNISIDFSCWFLATYAWVFVFTILSTSFCDVKIFIIYANATLTYFFLLFWNHTQYSRVHTHVDFKHETTRFPYIYSFQSNDFIVLITRNKSTTGHRKKNTRKWPCVIDKNEVKHLGLRLVGQNKS